MSPNFFCFDFRHALDMETGGRQSGGRRLLFQFVQARSRRRDSRRRRVSDSRRTELSPQREQRIRACYRQRTRDVVKSFGIALHILLPDNHAAQPVRNLRGIRARSPEFS